MAKKKISTRTPKHAAGRLVQRYTTHCSIDELQQKIDADDFEFKKRQSVSRSLCLAIVNGHDVWFVLNRKTRQPVTVLTREMAESQML
jgi:hypothetical protein